MFALSKAVAVTVFAPTLATGTPEAVQLPPVMTACTPPTITRLTPEAFVPASETVPETVIADEVVEELFAGAVMATAGGAAAIGQADRIGSLEPGKRADVIVVDLGHAPHSVPMHDPLLQFEQGRMFLRCSSCGFESPGWDTGDRRPRLRFSGDAARHQLHQVSAGSEAVS